MGRVYIGKTLAPSKPINHYSLGIYCKGLNILKSESGGSWK